MANSALWLSSAGSPPRRPAQSNKVKATRDDWLEIALRVLALEGVDHVTVLNLSERLRVSRSSFYWYFKNRDELLGALLDRWDQLNTRSIVAQAEAAATTVNETVCNVFRCWVNPAIFSPRLDFRGSRVGASLPSRAKGARPLRSYQDGSDASSVRALRL
jgi:AcrR family transcriptional regulator